MSKRSFLQQNVLCGILFHQTVRCRSTARYNWLLSMRKVAILSTFPVTGLRLVGYTQKPELKLT